MGRIDMRDIEFLSWLRYTLNPNTKLPIVKDWLAVFAFAEKQALTGICMPVERPKNLDQALVLQWIGQVQLIEQRNRLLNVRIGQLFSMLESEGFDCCLLKGQGNAEMYPNPLMRCSGDIDVWIDAEEERVYDYVRKLCPNAELSFKHIHFPIFSDVPVDVHSTPLRLYSNYYLKRLNCWIEKNKAEQFAHKIKLTGIEKCVSVPTCSFNVVYQMGHMLIHTLDEGVGLRQIVDYFYALKGLELTDTGIHELINDLKYLGMFRFARAVMWIENQILGVPAERCLIEPDEKFGKKLLADILEGGNFGHHSERYGGKNGFIIEA